VAGAYWAVAGAVTIDTGAAVIIAAIVSAIPGTAAYLQSRRNTAKISSVQA